ncbi:unnamed protein product [Knipowitschia caucasica]|uniref:Uncharacterized protein n=1 Tax=Knipowitschia caucasica TaxID=637954 RepID=A0AAV2MLY4_KNICA
MKVLYTLSALLALCEGDSYWTTTTRYPYITAGPGVSLKGRMLTLSQSSGVTFYQPYYSNAPAEGDRTTERPRVPTTTFNPRWWTTTNYWTTPTPSNSVSVCLRFMADSYGNLFKLALRSPLTLIMNGPQGYALTSDTYPYYSHVILVPRIPLRSFTQTQPWTSVCVVLDSVRNVVQLFQGGLMSIRKIPPSRIVWSGEPVVDISGFDGQVTDLEVWDYPLQYREVFYYMNYGSRGTVLTWSNIAYRPRGTVLFEDTYTRQQKRPISSIQSEKGRRRGRAKTQDKSDRKQRRKQML